MFRLAPHYVLVLAALSLGGCADSSFGSALRPDLPGLPGDVGGMSSDIGDVGPDPLVFKNAASKDDTYVVPLEVSAKRALAVGSGQVAWIATASDGEVVLRVWDLAAGKDPETVVFPYLANPSALALGDGWLYFVDDVWGDKDIYGIDLSDGSFSLVAGGIGDQDRPAALGTRVVWQDCRDCVPGTEGADHFHIFERDMASSEGERQLSNEEGSHQGPVLGSMRDGQIGVAWVFDYNRLRLRAPEVDITHDTGVVLVESVALAAGRLAWRESPAIINPDSMIPSPMIINPDSMMPSDINLYDPAEDATTTLTVHAEIGASTPIKVVGFSDRVAFAQRDKDSDGLASNTLHVFAVGGVAEELMSVTEPDVSEIALGAEALGFIALRTDNEGLPDVWLMPTPLDP